jgi:hypothetical protein
MQLGFFSLLALIFITLKLLGYIDWSWWLVLLPAYVGIIFILILFVILLALGQKPKFKITKTK